MILRLVILGLAILGLVSIHVGQAGAQGALPAPQSQAQCMKGFVPLRAEWEKLGKLIKAASERHAPPAEACKLISDFRQAETTMIRYIEANSAACRIPPQVADQLKGGHKNTEALQKKVCTAAEQSEPVSLSEMLGAATSVRRSAGPVGEFEIYR